MKGWKMKNPLLEKSKVVCPICKTIRNKPIGDHIRREHGEQAFVQAVLDAKRTGVNDAEIGERFGVTFKQLEHIVTKAYGINLSVLSRPKQIKSWAPASFRLETTTVWSFKQRGNWATHDGRYRGNWSPYIPRNLMLRYTQPGDLVLDPFVGGGTTAVEAKLLGRRCIARDINPACVELALENLRFNPPHTLFSSESPVYEPEVSVGDARYLHGIPDNSVDLICAHPPYAGIISYTSSIDGDLSQLGIPEFLREMGYVAAECYRVLKPGSKCAVLIGDTRQRKHVVPIGFETIGAFLRAGFRLREIIIKRQHNCKTTGFWTERSVKHNFLLLAHEYLPIFEKPIPDMTPEANAVIPSPVVVRVQPPTKNVDSLETTTVWAFPPESLEELTVANIVQRYGDRLIIHAHDKFTTTTLEDYTKEVQVLVADVLRTSQPGEFIVIQARDFRAGRYVLPVAKAVVDALGQNPYLWIKEIIIVAPSEVPADPFEDEEYLHIVHQYLLVYEVVK